MPLLPPRRPLKTVTLIWGMAKQKESLEKLAEANAQGKVSDARLAKACEQYKALDKDFVDNEEYDIVVTKSLYDHLNGNEQEEICKARVVVGQTKVVDGVVYIYRETPNAQQKYGWRVYKRGRTKPKPTEQQLKKQKESEEYVNEMFPATMDDFKFVKRLGGSTGAGLYMDEDGNQYVVKSSSNTHASHTYSEYIANQLYSIFGVDTPDYEYYKGNGYEFLVSKFIPNTRVANKKDYPELAKNFIVDAFLANYDVYQNDNVLVDLSGKIYRVDNGGSLKYRAQGAEKVFDDTADSIDSMIRYNPTVLGDLTDDDIISQIDALLEKKDAVLKFLESNQDEDYEGDTQELADIIKGRFRAFEKYGNELKKKAGRESEIKKQERNLLPPEEMYRELTEEELADVWKNAKGTSSGGKIMMLGNHGWELLNSICKLRGFDAHPLVVSSDEYWDKVVPNAKYQLFRGISGDTRNTGRVFADKFKYEDDVYWGSYGAYGQGIYAHINDGDRNKDRTKDGYKGSDAYQHAYTSYCNTTGVVMNMALENDVKTIDAIECEKEIKAFADTDEVKKLVKEQEDTQTRMNELEKQINEADEAPEKAIKREMHWSQSVLDSFRKEIDNIDWGRVKPDGTPDYPGFDEFVLGNMKSWIEANGGKCEEKVPGSGMYIFTLPNSKTTFTLTRYMWENKAIKRRNQFSPAFNYPLKRFTDWMMKEHYDKIQARIDKDKDKIEVDVKALEKEMDKCRDKYWKLNTKIREGREKALDKLGNGMLAEVVKYVIKNRSAEAIGLYAAIKGYDALTVQHGNGSNNSFAVILNRSKVIVEE